MPTAALRRNSRDCQAKGSSLVVPSRLACDTESNVRRRPLGLCRDKTGRAQTHQLGRHAGRQRQALRDALATTNDERDAILHLRHRAAEPAGRGVGLGHQDNRAVRKGARGILAVAERARACPQTFSAMNMLFACSRRLKRSRQRLPACELGPAAAPGHLGQWPTPTRGGQADGGVTDHCCRRVTWSLLSWPCSELGRGAIGGTARR